MSSIVEELTSGLATPNVGDEEFELRVRDNQRRVVAIARGVLGNIDDAEDVAQDAFVQAYRRYASLRSPDKFRAWINRIVFRLALNRKRSRMRRLHRDTTWHESRPDATRAAGQATMARMELEEIRAHIDALPEKLRIVLLLCAVEDMEQAEVAAVLRIPPGTVRSRLHLARKQLLNRMSP